MKITTTLLAMTLLVTLATDTQAVTIIGAGGGLGVASSGNGNFEADETPGNPGAFTGPGTYTATPHWHNLNEDPPADPGNFTQDSGTLGSPESGGRAAFQFSNATNSGFFAANDTGHTVLNAGETFDISFWASKHGNSGQWANPPIGSDVEKWRFSLLTAPSGISVDVKRSETTELGAVEFVVPESDVPVDTENWRSYSATGFYTTTGADVGKTLYLGMEFLNEQGVLVFPRVDIIQLDVNLVPEPSTVAILSLAGLSLCIRRSR